MESFFGKGNRGLLLPSRCFYDHLHVLRCAGLQAELLKRLWPEFTKRLKRRICFLNRLNESFDCARKLTECSYEIIVHLMLRLCIVRGQQVLAKGVRGLRGSRNSDSASKFPLFCFL